MRPGAGAAVASSVGDVPRANSGSTRLPRSGLLLAPGLALANVLGYVLIVVLSRWLGPEEFGAFGALLGLSLIAIVPALAMQPVVARHTALIRDAGASPAVLTGPVIRAAVYMGLALTAMALLVAPLVTDFIHLDSQVPALWLAASLAPAMLVTACQGLIQGAERFTALAALFIWVPLARLVSAATFVMLGYGVAGALAGVAIGSLLGAGLGLLLTRSRSSAGSGRTLPPAFWREFAHATFAILGLFVLANVDVLLARHYLPRVESGLYAVGTIVAKVAFWAPQFVVVLAFPRLTDPERAARVLARATLLIGAIGAAVVAASLTIAEPALRFFVGAAYVDLAQDAWVFAAIGASLALVQLLLFSGIASADARMSVVVAAATVAMVVAVVVVAHESLWQLATTVLVVVSSLAVLGMMMQRFRRVRR